LLFDSSTHGGLDCPSRRIRNDVMMHEKGRVYEQCTLVSAPLMEAIV